MESRDFVYLQEAYQEIYQLDEGVEIATEYFYEMGLNEYGINSLIEELGVEEFVDWVYDISESYILTEGAKRGGTVLKGAALRKSRKEQEQRTKAFGTKKEKSPAEIAYKKARRAKTVEVARDEQKPTPRSETPSQTKKGIAGALSRAVSSVESGVQRHREATRQAGEVAQKLGRGLSQAWQGVADSKLGKHTRVEIKKGLRRQQRAIDQAAPAVGRAAGRAAARVPAIVSTYRFGERVGRALRENEEFESWVEGLWEEGYDLSDYTWEGLYEAYIEEANRGERELGLTSKERARKRNLEYRIGYIRPDERPDQSVTYPKTKSSRKRVFGDKGYLLHPHDNDQKSARKTHKLIRGRRGEEHIERRGIKTRGEAQESYEAYNAIADYLLDEGYANDLESADVIIASMSEEWIMDILDEAADNVIMTVKSPSGKERSKIRKGSSRPSDSHRHETSAQIADRRFSQILSDRARERESNVNAQRQAYRTKRAIERATNRSDRDENDWSDVRLNAPKPKPARELRGAERQQAIRQIRQNEVNRKFKDQEKVKKFRRRHGLSES